MQPGKSPRPRTQAASTVAVAVLCALAPATALGAATRPSDGALSPRLAELAKPAVRTAPAAEQAEALSLAAEGPGSLLREGNRVLVEVRFDSGAAARVEDLRQAGAEVVNVSSGYQTVTVAAKPSELQALNGVPGIAGTREVLQPIAYSTCPSGAAVSEGVQQLHAGDASGEARQVFGVDGGGVTVGILSDSFNRATMAIGGGPIATHQSNDVANGDLPGLTNTCAGETTPVRVLDDSDASGEDEGRAMAQIVHDVAPGANLAFATAFTGETAFAENIEELAKPVAQGGAGARVIADDVSYFDEPFFQEGPIGVAVSKVTEQGVSYFSSAGNNNLINDEHDIGSWEAPQYRDGGSCPSALAAFEAAEGIFLNRSHCMDFDPGPATDTTFGITVGAGETLTADLQWAEAWEAVNTDLDVFLLGPEGKVVAAQGDDNPATGRPVEVLGWKNESADAANVQLVINRFSGGLPRLKVALLENGGDVSSTEYESSAGGDVVGPTIFGHNGGEDANTVGAIRFNTGTAPEPYSSRGPVIHYFRPVNGTAPAAPLESPVVLSKPDLIATDCGKTSFFVPTGTAGLFRFCGTSAAAPHAAAIAALMLDEKETATPQEIRMALLDGSAQVGSSGPCAVGAGLAEAVGAIESLLSPEAASLESCTAPASWKVIESERSEGVSIPVAPVEEIPTGFSPKPIPRAAPPNAFFRKHPPKVIPTHRHAVKLAFGFGSDQGGVTFLCTVDKGRFHPCAARFVRRYALGRHVLRVKARRNSDGAPDPTPAVYRFQVKRLRR